MIRRSVGSKRTLRQVTKKAGDLFKVVDLEHGTHEIGEVSETTKLWVVEELVLKYGEDPVWKEIGLSERSLKEVHEKHLRMLEYKAQQHRERREALIADREAIKSKEAIAKLYKENNKWYRRLWRFLYRSRSQPQLPEARVEKY